MSLDKAKGGSLLSGFIAPVEEEERQRSSSDSNGSSGKSATSRASAGRALPSAK